MNAESLSQLELARMDKWITRVARPGEIVFVELPKGLSDAHRECLASGLAKFSSKYGIGVVLLSPGMFVNRIDATATPA